MALMFKVVDSGGNTVEMRYGSADPSTGAGEAAPLGSLYLQTTGNIYWKSAAADTGWSLISPTFFPGIYGDGSDGDVTETTRTLARDTFYNNLTVPAGVTLDTGGFRVFVKGTLTVASTGIIDHPGANGGAAGGTAAAATAGTLAASSNGGTSGSGAGGNGGAISSNGIGGTGGAGGAGSGGAGGAGGVITAPGAQVSSIRAGVIFAMMGQSFGISGTTAATQVAPRGGSGGGGGGGNGLNAGAGGGGGGGYVMVAARTCVNNGTIRAKGGDGGNASGAGGGGGGWGGGGGGGGGVCVLITDTFTGNEPTAPGGAAGAGLGTGVAGAAGASGYAVRLHS